SARVLNRMSEREATELGFQEFERNKYVRVDKAKGNYSPAEKAVWRQFINVELPNGDDVGVLDKWTYPGQGLSPEEVAQFELIADQPFTRLLGKFRLKGRRVNDKTPNYYAPKLFAAEPEAREAKLPGKPT